MDSGNTLRYQLVDQPIDSRASRSPALGTVKMATSPCLQAQIQLFQDRTANPTVTHPVDASDIITCLRNGQLLMVDSRRKNGLIIYKSFHAEFAGPGAVVGSVFDLDCQHVLPVGNLLLISPQDHEERQKAFLIRRQWVRLTQQFTDNSVPLQRAQMILNQFENYFDQGTIDQIPDEAFSLLVGVFPHTVRMARRKPGKLNVRVRV